MSTISAAAVNELRKRTDLPLMECKKALTEAGGDMEKAIEYLRSQFAKAAVKREGNEVAEGRIGVFIDAAQAQAAIVEMRCESAPSAKADQFIAMVTDLAKLVVANNPGDVPAFMAQPAGKGTVQDRINEVVGLIREKMIVQRFARLTGGIFGQYVHHDGTVGVLIQCEGKAAADELLRDVSAHIAALNPQYALSTEVPADVIAKEKAVFVKQIEESEKAAEEKAKEEGKPYKPKPTNILEKIAEGKLKTWMAETVLTEQPMANAAKYPNQTVGQALQKAGLAVKTYVRYKVGAVTAS